MNDSVKGEVYTQWQCEDPQNAEADYALGAKWLLLRVTGGNLREPQENWLLEANKGKTY